METFPKIISVDDHTVEPAHVWRDRLPAKYADSGPRIVRAPLKEMTFMGGRFAPVMGTRGDEGPVGDWWVYEDLYRPLTRLETVGSTITFANCCFSMVDWLMSGKLERFPNLRIMYAEGQIGWIPYILERADVVWEENRGWGGVADKVHRPPSELFAEHVYGCFFDDAFGLKNLDAIGVGNVLYETDYPHSDSTWPRSREVGEGQMGHLDPEVVDRIVRGNAIDLLGLTEDGLWAGPGA